jgi:hypothetical protein
LATIRGGDFILTLASILDVLDVVNPELLRMQGADVTWADRVQARANTVSSVVFMETLDFKIVRVESSRSCQSQ